MPAVPTGLPEDLRPPSVPCAWHRGRSGTAVPRPILRRVPASRTCRLPGRTRRSREYRDRTWPVPRHSPDPPTSVCAPRSPLSPAPAGRKRVSISSTPSGRPVGVTASVRCTGRPCTPFPPPPNSASPSLVASPRIVQHGGVLHRQHHRFQTAAIHRGLAMCVQHMLLRDTRIRQQAIGSFLLCRGGKHLRQGQARTIGPGAPHVHQPPPQARIAQRACAIFPIGPVRLYRPMPGSAPHWQPSPGFRAQLSSPMPRQRMHPDRLRRRPAPARRTTGGAPRATLPARRPIARPGAGRIHVSILQKRCRSTRSPPLRREHLRRLREHMGSQVRYPYPGKNQKTATAEPPPANVRPARLPTSRSSDPDRPGASSPPTISPRPGDPGGSRQSSSSAQHPDCDPIPVDDACAAGDETPPRPSPPHVAPRPRPMPPAHSPTPGPDSPKPVPGPMPPDAPPATPPPDAPPVAATPCRPTRCTTPPDDSASLHARKSPEPGTTESPTDPSTSP